MNKLLSNKYIQFIVTIGIGITLGALFYPSKTIERELETKYERKIERLVDEHSKKTSQLTEENKKLSKKITEVQIESSKKVSSLKIENTKLKQKTQERTLKIVKPDGTIVEQTFKESETEVVSKVITDVRQEFVTKVKSIEKKWESIHKKRVSSIKEEYSKKIKEKDKVISSLKQSEKIQINKKSFAVAVGVLRDKGYYTNLSYDLVGPVFINMQLQSDEGFSNNRAGVGVGLKF